jgi:hypothetical protein
LTAEKRDSGEIEALMASHFYNMTTICHSAIKYSGECCFGGGDLGQAGENAFEMGVAMAGLTERDLKNRRDLKDCGP